MIIVVAMFFVLAMFLVLMLIVRMALHLSFLTVPMVAILNQPRRSTTHAGHKQSPPQWTHHSASAHHLESDNIKEGRTLMAVGQVRLMRVGLARDYSVMGYSCHAGDQKYAR